MKNRLSYSSVEKYLVCPQQWYRYYLRGIREKYTGSALVFGSAFDKGLNQLLKHNPIPSPITTPEELFLEAMIKFKHNGTEIDLSNTNLINYGNEDFDFDILTDEDKRDIYAHTRCKTEVLKSYHESLIIWKKQKRLEKEDIKEFNYISWVSLKRKGLLFLEAYKEQVIPLIKRVIAVQKEIVIKNDNGDEFVFYIDLIAELQDGRIVIFDNKTSGSPYKDDSVLSSKQLASYLGAIEELNEYQFDPNNLYQGYIVIVKKIRKKKEPKVNIQILIDKVPSDVVDSVFNDYDLVNEKIHNGEFPARPETCRGVFGKCFCSLSKDQVVDISVNWSKK